MQILQRIFTAFYELARRFFQAWSRDMQQRRGCTGKSMSFFLGFFVIALVCSLPMLLVVSIGVSIGVISTTVPTQIAASINTPVSTETTFVENNTRTANTPTLPTQNTTVTPETQASQTPTRMELCSAEVKRASRRSEPEYVGLQGFTKASLSSTEYDRNLPKTPWFVPILQRTGPTLWEPSNETIPAKTPVRVLEQHLVHQGYGIYKGFLIVKSLDDMKNYTIDHYNFAPTDYWNCPPYIAVKYGPILAKIKSGIQPVDRDGRWIEVGKLREVLCTSLPSVEDQNFVINGVECYMYKNYGRGYGGASFIFPSAGLEVIY